MQAASHICCAPTPEPELTRNTLRAFLVAQCAFERTQRLRHGLLLLLALASAIVWMLAMWPGLLPARLGSVLLGGWWLLFAAALYAGLAELLWLRRARHARKNLAAARAAEDEINDEEARGYHSAR
jgi:hypothetical protein